MIWSRGRGMTRLPCDVVFLWASGTHEGFERRRERGVDHAGDHPKDPMPNDDAGQLIPFFGADRHQKGGVKASLEGTNSVGLVPDKNWENDLYP
ncbi:hypothetical protein A3D73_01235 [Candidatus Uhrbacteria bacterium RIFCSPHIGHO2_02_FULL_60_44]|nr:MAG: hypothetical protein A3D73_01235 [Candidatus Uhrbacteria bacterium RIFCSPHIGHO2_02_FULL_60_44]